MTVRPVVLHTALSRRRIVNDSELGPVVPASTSKLGVLETFADLSLDDLQTAQARWYATQQEARAAKALGEGREYRLSTAWPVIPVTTTERSVS